MTTAAETIKSTAVPHDLIVEITRDSNPHSLRPFVLSVRDKTRGVASEIGRFSCEGTASHAFDHLVRRLADGG